MNCERREKERTLELFNLRGLIVDINTLDVALHFAHKELGNGTFSFRTLCYC